MLPEDSLKTTTYSVNLVPTCQGPALYVLFSRQGIAIQQVRTTQEFCLAFCAFVDAFGGTMPCKQLLSSFVSICPRVGVPAAKEYYKRMREEQRFFLIDAINHSGYVTHIERAHEQYKMDIPEVTARGRAALLRHAREALDADGPDDEGFIPVVLKRAPKKAMHQINPSHRKHRTALK